METYVSVRLSLTFASGERTTPALVSAPIFLCLALAVILEYAPIVLDDTLLQDSLITLGNVYSVASSPIETAHPSMRMTPAPTIDPHFDALRARNIDKRQGKGNREKKRCSGKL